MDNSTAESVKSTLGSEFQQYCARHKIPLEKNKCGAFMVPNASVLGECIDTLERYKDKVHNRVKAIQKYKSSSKDLDHKKRYSKRLQGQYETDKNREENFCRETTNITTPRSFLANLRLKLDLRDTSSSLPSYAVHKAPKGYILNTAKNGEEIYECILKRTMKDTVVVDYKASVPPISLILESLQKQHKRFHYSSVLTHLISTEKCDQDLKSMHKVTTKQLKLFFNLVFAKVVPAAIFGKLNNLNKIKRALFRLLNEPRFKSFDLLPHIEKLDISCIAWLRDVQCRETQWLIIAKVVKWFFTGFLMRILRTQFHVTFVSSTNNKRLYIARPDWCYEQKKFIKKKIQSNTLHPNVECDVWDPPIGIYKLHPTHSSVRPIFIPHSYTTKEQTDLHMILKFLKQLHITEYGSFNFEENWKTIIQYKRNSTSEKLHLVSCDIIDAFGSIVLDQLYDIIESLCKKLPETLILRWYGVKDERRTELDTVCYKQYFDDPNLQLPLKSGSLYSCVSHEHSQQMRKNWLLNKIWRYICHQRVEISETKYIIGRGIVQGGMLSPIFSEIYYSFVLNKEMSIFLNSGIIIRYMDDILYATESEMLAKQFLQLTKTGIPQYNCRFNELKTQSNIACDGNTATNRIKYIGYKINCDTLEVEPSDPTTDIRYLISFSSKKNLTPLELFEKRLYNISCLKLSNVVLDPAINSISTMTSILKKAGLLQAKGARVLIQELFNDIDKNIRDIVKIIKISNKKIATYVIKILLKSKDDIKVADVCAWNEKIVFILWMSYKEIFKNDHILRKYFIKACKYAAVSMQ